jgi:hypothetical protein
MEGLRIGICLDVKKKPFEIVEIGPTFVVPPSPLPPLYSYYYSPYIIVVYPNLNIVSNNYPTCNLYLY